MPLEGDANYKKISDYIEGEIQDLANEESAEEGHDESLPKKLADLVIAMRAVFHERLSLETIMPPGEMFPLFKHQLEAMMDQLHLPLELQTILKVRLESYKEEYGKGVDYETIFEGVKEDFPDESEILGHLLPYVESLAQCPEKIEPEKLGETLIQQVKNILRQADLPLDLEDRILATCEWAVNHPEELPVHARKESDSPLAPDWIAAQVKEQFHTNLKKYNRTIALAISISILVGVITCVYVAKKYHMLGIDELRKKYPEIANKYLPEEQPPPVPMGTQDAELKKRQAMGFIESILASNSSFAATNLKDLADEEKQSAIKENARNLYKSMKMAGMPLTAKNITFCLAEQQKESDFRINPEKPWEAILKKLTRFHVRLGWFERDINVLEEIKPFTEQFPELKYRFDYYMRTLKDCKTEFDLYQWAQNLSNTLEKGKLRQLVFQIFENGKGMKITLANLFKSPQEVLDYVVNKLRHMPSTFGIYQVNVDRAIHNAHDDYLEMAKHPEWLPLVRNGKIDRDLLIRSLVRAPNDPKKNDLLPRHVAEAFILKYYLKLAIEANDLNRNGSVDDNEVYYAASDYHSGPYSCRGAAIQHFINRLLALNPPLRMDGDLAIFNEEGDIDTGKMSQTEEMLNRYVNTYLPLSEKQELLSHIRHERGIPDGKKLSKEDEADLLKLLIHEFVAKGKSVELRGEPLWKILEKKPAFQPRMSPVDAERASSEPAYPEKVSRIYNDLYPQGKIWLDRNSQINNRQINGGKFKRQKIPATSIKKNGNGKK